MKQLRDVKIVVTIETNKGDEKKRFSLYLDDDDDTVTALLERVAEWTKEAVEDCS